MSELASLRGPVHVIGTGLVGTSIGLACRRAGLAVLLSDRSADHVRTASGLGAGTAYAGEAVQLVVVAVPPGALGPAIRTALAGDAVVTDVGSVKSAPLRELAGVPPLPREALARYVGSHPMAGSERSGPLAASAGLFDGRPWAVTPHEGADPEAVALVTALAETCGAVPLVLSPAEHDRAVARTSHLPYLAAVLVAARLADAPAEHVALSGQGVRDVTRVAGSDPDLWQQIVTANADAVLELLEQVQAELAALTDAVRDRGDLVPLLARGVSGTRAIPGKHGGPARPSRTVYVAVPDHPGELARLFADAGAAGVNIEDVRIDHDPGRPVGLLELSVAADLAEQLLGALAAAGWDTHR